MMTICFTGNISGTVILQNEDHLVQDAAHLWCSQPTLKKKKKGGRNFLSVHLSREAGRALIRLRTEDRPSPEFHGL